jgi:prepilin-type N-terminal cleavage/methylation domain-containing protein
MPIRSIKKSLRSSLRSESGFTLVELMVVVSIVAIAFAIGGGAYGQWYPRYQIRSAATSLHYNLSLARMAAMKQNTTINISTPALVGTQLQVNFTNPAGVNVITPLAEQYNYVTQVQVVPAGSTITFNSMGLGPANFVAIVLTNRAGLQYSVGISPSGKIRWCPNSTGIC